MSGHRSGKVFELFESWQNVIREGKKVLYQGADVVAMPRKDFEELVRKLAQKDQALEFICAKTQAMPSGSEGNLMFHICQEALFAAAPAIKIKIDPNMKPWEWKLVSE